MTREHQPNKGTADDIVRSFVPCDGVYMSGIARELLARHLEHALDRAGRNALARARRDRRARK